MDAVDSERNSSIFYIEAYIVNVIVTYTIAHFVTMYAEHCVTQR